MLAENCPDCKVPLMKERASDERLCVNCDITFVPDGQGLRPTNRTTPDQTEEELQQQQTQQGEQLEGSEGVSTDDASSYSYDPRADPRLGPFASAASERPPGEADPLDASGARGSRAITPSTGAAESRSSDHDGTAATAAAAAAAAAAATATAGQGSASAANAPEGDPSVAAAPVEDVADLLSAKMIQGWALLDKYCPRCNTVLVRSKANKRMFCVACDTWVVSEAEYREQQQQQKPLAAGHQSQPERPPQAGLTSPRSKALGDPAGVGAQAHGQPQPREAPPPAPAPAPAAPSLEIRQPPPQQLPAGASPQQQQELQFQSYPQQQQQQQHPAMLQPHAASPLLPLGLEAALPAFVSAPPQVPPGAGPIAAAGVPPFHNHAQSQQQQQQLLPPAPAQQQQQQPLMQLPLMYQHFFAPIAAAAGGGAGSCSRGASPPQQGPGVGPSWSHETLHGSFQQLQQQQTRQAGQASSSGQGISGIGGGSGGDGSKQPSGTALLLTIGKTVALKMAEAQGLLERTPALDTERARSYVALISECLDLLSKLHSLQQ